MIERHGLVGDAATELRDRNLKMRWEQGDQLREYLKVLTLALRPTPYHTRIYWAVLNSAE